MKKFPYYVIKKGKKLIKDFLCFKTNFLCSKLLALLNAIIGNYLHGTLDFVPISFNNFFSQILTYIIFSITTAAIVKNNILSLIENPQKWYLKYFLFKPQFINIQFQSYNCIYCKHNHIFIHKKKYKFSNNKVIYNN